MPRPALVSGIYDFATIDLWPSGTAQKQSKPPATISALPEDSYQQPHNPR